MKHLTQHRNKVEGLLSLYYLMIHADGNVSEKELKMGEVMCKHELIDHDELQQVLEEKKKESKENIYRRTIKILKTCSHDFNVKCIAWMSLIANSDGFMSSEEWGLLYRIYSSELYLDLKEIMDFQKTLPRN